VKTEAEAAIDAVMARLDLIAEDVKVIREIVEKKPEKRAPKERKPGAESVTGVIRSVGTSNDWGFRKTRIVGDDRDFTTQDKGDIELVRALIDAHETNRSVTVTFDEVANKKPKYPPNFYVRTVQVHDQKVNPLPEIDDGDVPF
jgi:hypothetical protein